MASKTWGTPTVLSYDEEWVVDIFIMFCKEEVSQGALRRKNGQWRPLIWNNTDGNNATSRGQCDACMKTTDEKTRMVWQKSCSNIKRFLQRRKNIRLRVAFEYLLFQSFEILKCFYWSRNKIEWFEVLNTGKEFELNRNSAKGSWVCRFGSVSGAKSSKQTWWCGI